MSPYLRSLPRGKTWYLWTHRGGASFGCFAYPIICVIYGLRFSCAGYLSLVHLPYHGQCLAMCLLNSYWEMVWIHLASLTSLASALPRNFLLSVFVRELFCLIKCLVGGIGTALLGFFFMPWLLQKFHGTRWMLRFICSSRIHNKRSW